MKLTEQELRWLTCCEKRERQWLATRWVCIVVVLVQRETPHGSKSLSTLRHGFLVARSGHYLPSDGEFLRHRRL